MFWMRLWCEPGAGWHGAVAALQVCGAAGGSLRRRVHTSSVTRAACSRGKSPELSARRNEGCSAVARNTVRFTIRPFSPSDKRRTFQPTAMLRRDDTVGIWITVTSGLLLHLHIIKNCCLMFYAIKNI